MELLFVATTILFPLALAVLVAWAAYCLYRSE